MNITGNRRINSFLYLCVGFVHLVFLVVFWKENVIPLAYLNIFSVVFYMVLALRAFKRGRLQVIFKACMAEILLVAMFSTALAGWECGFMMYVIGVIPLVFYMVYQFGAVNVKIALIFSIIFGGAAYLTWFLTSSGSLKMYTLSAPSQNLLFLMNLTLTILMMIGYSVLFVEAVNAEQVRMMQMYERLENSANVDGLTRLMNRRTLDECFNRFINKAKGPGLEFSVLMCDIDNFKKVNDTYGHECGDDVLKNVSSALKHCIRGEDRIFRWGGEEILILVNGGKEIAKAVGERCLEAVRNTETQCKDDVVKVTVTIGVSSYHHGDTQDSMIEKADKNLYHGKRNGKNQVVV